jgi:hypothetical protein
MIPKYSKVDSEAHISNTEYYLAVLIYIKRPTTKPLHSSDSSKPNIPTHSSLLIFPPPPFRYPIGPSLNMIVNPYSINTSSPVVTLANTVRYVRDVQGITNSAGKADYFPEYKTFRSSTFQTSGARVEFAAKNLFTINCKQASRVPDTLVEIEDTFGPSKLGSVDMQLDGKLVSRFRFDIFG